ncbi:MAG: DUF2125 domain-containing protein [Paracoccaceae bacterium]
MTYLNWTRTAVCTAALMTGTTALADVTAQDVWDQWQDSMSTMGDGAVSVGSESYENGILTVSDVSLDFSDDMSTVTVDMGDLVFEEQGDGTVSIAMADSYPVSITSDEETVNLTVVQSGVDLIAGGTPDAMSYDLTADQYAIILDSIEGSTPAPEGDLRVAMNNVTGTYAVSGDDLRDMSYDLSIDSVDLLADLTEAETDTTVLMSGKINSLLVDANVTMPPDADFENAPDDAFAQGLAMAANYSIEGSDYIFDITETGQSTSGTISTGESMVDVSLDSDAMLYDVNVNGVQMQIETPDLPFPVDVSLADYGILIDMPLASTEEARDFALGLNLSELTVNEEVWSMIDPAGQLDHGPATVALDLTGEGKLFFDLMDPEQQQAAAMAGMPGELNTLTLENLLISAVGANVTGSGGFTFDNTDLQTIPGVPRPEGSVTIDISGANTLIDNLVAMGLLPDDQAMMGRMMMGMFARSTGDDQLQSVIEVNEQGHVLANGQRLQ